MSMSEKKIPPAQVRENPDPHEQSAPIPWPVLIFVALMVSFGMVYIAMSNVNTPGSWGDDRELAELQGERKAGGRKADGAAIYASLCVACHQATGIGLPGVFPPLAGSEWVLGDDETLIKIVLQGVTGKLTVKGETYSGVMPAFKEQLGDEEVAAVASYLRTQWGNNATAIDAKQVAAAREALSSRKEPFAGDSELTQPEK